MPAQDTPQLAGKDLARLALANARAASRTAPTAAPARGKTRRRTLRPGSGRDPIPLAAAITQLGTDLPLEAGLAGGSILDQWPTLCPQYDGLVQPIAYDETRGRLDLRPGNHSYAAQLRILGGQLAKQINDKMGKVVVRSIRVLPVGTITAPTSAAPAPQRPAQDAPVKTRETASSGYRATREAHLAHKAEQPVADPHLAAALERQARVLADPTRREPETAFTDAVAEQERHTGGTALDRAEQVRRAAIARKQHGDTPVRRAFDVA